MTIEDAKAQAAVEFEAQIMVRAEEIKAGYLSGLKDKASAMRSELEAVQNEINGLEVAESPAEEATETPSEEVAEG